MKEQKIEALQKQIKEFEKETAELSEREGAVRARVAKEEDERKACDELGSIQSQIKDRENEAKRIREEVMAIERNAALREAEGLVKEKEKLLAQIADIDRKGLQLQEIFQRNLPMKKIQVSSAVFIRVKKQIESPGLPAFDIHGYPVPSLPKQFHEIQDVATLMNFQTYIKAGWTLCDGETVPPPEELTAENSMEITTIPMPDIFFDFLPTQQQVLRIPILAPVAKKK